MIIGIIKLCYLTVIISTFTYAQSEQKINYKNSDFRIDQLISILDSLSISGNTIFNRHCRSIIDVINAEKEISTEELSDLNGIYMSFSDNSVTYNNSSLSSYLSRKRPFIISWISDTDSNVSLAWLIPPENWDPEKEYPLYVSLHGLYPPYDNAIRYMTRYLSPESILEKSFEDGYALFPWGRGNNWYEGIGETDVWESIDEIEAMVKIDPRRKYIVGHSMGGYGAWGIAQKSAGIWAGLGVYAGALWYNNSRYLNSESAGRLKDLPVYIVCGEQDGLLSINQQAYNLLQQAGNNEIAFVSYPGGHESLFPQWEAMHEWLKSYDQDPANVDYPALLAGYKIYYNYPNPFNPSTSIKYFLPENARIKIDIVNVSGQVLANLVDQYENSGNYTITWDARGFSSGIYFCRFKAEGNILVEKTIKLMLLK